MKLLEALIITIFLYTVLSGQIKKNAVAFYTGTYALVAVMISYYMLNWNQYLPTWFTQWGTDLFKRGALSTATFIIVMYLGAITKHTPQSIKLMKIRGEISIIGCILAFGHNVIYGTVYFTLLFTNPQALEGTRLVAAVLSVTLIVLMIPLFLTSFQCIRKKMNPRSWKKLQRLAYPFYYLMYIHVMVLYSENPKAHLFDIVVYTAIYLAYTILRLRKYALSKKRKAIKANEKG